jgi:hypothetical protein
MNTIIFRVAGTEIDLDEIGKNLGLDADVARKKGDVRYDRITKKSFEIKEDFWLFSIEVKDMANTEDKLAAFVDLLYKNKAYIKQLSRVCKTTIWVTIYQETYQYNLSFSKNVLEKISEMDLELSVTCMQLQDFYTGQYKNIPPI